MNRWQIIYLILGLVATLVISYSLALCCILYEAPRWLTYLIMFGVAAGIGWKVSGDIEAMDRR